MRSCLVVRGQAVLRTRSRLHRQNRGHVTLLGWLLSIIVIYHRIRLLVHQQFIISQSLLLEHELGM